MIYCENIVNVTLFFFYSPKISEPHFFSPIFGNAIATIVTNFFFPISAMALPQLVCQNFFFFLFTSGTPRMGSRIGHRKFGIPVVEIQHFLSLPFSSSFSYFWLNFCNDNTEIQTLSLISQINLNSSYNTN